MSYRHFTLASVDRAAGHPPPSYEVAVAINACGEYQWYNGSVMGSSCTGHEEWDAVIDDLIKSLERVRRAGHQKLNRNRFAGPWPRCQQGRHGTVGSRNQQVQELDAAKSPKQGMNGLLAKYLGSSFTDTSPSDGKPSESK